MASRRCIHPFAIFMVTIVVACKSVAGEISGNWAALATPAKTLAGQSIGGYSAGCIGGAVALPLSGAGYQVMRVSRNRYYGHVSLIQFVQNLGQAVSNDNLGTLLVGDLGQPRGGPTPSGHRSHQTGLDVDIWFLLLNGPGDYLLTANERETWLAPSMLDAGAEALDYRRWTQAQEKVLQAAALQPEVDRIFVNPSIKRELCNRKTASSGAWLRKIRPWWKHDDHFHVRLKCPANNLHCKGQEPLPEGDGCDESLAFWFSKEAKEGSLKKSPPVKMVLPALCEQIKNDVGID